MKEMPHRWKRRETKYVPSPQDSSLGFTQWNTNYKENMIPCTLILQAFNL